MKNVRLADIGEIISGSTPSRANPDFWNGDIPWVSPYEINRLKSKYLTDTQEKITEAGFRSCSTKMLPKGSIIFSTRAPIGLIVIANIDVCTNQGFKSIIPNKGYHPEYVYYALKAHTKQLQSLGTGTTFLELSKKRFEEFKIPVPESLDDQIRIATLLSRAEGLIEKRRESLRLLDDLVKGVFLEMFGDPEDSWRKVRFEDEVDIQSGQVDPRKLPYSEMWHVGGDNIESGTGKLIKLQKANELGLISGKYLFSKGDILYSKIRPNLNKVARPEFDGICSADMYPLKPKSTELRHEFLMHVLTSQEFLSYAKKHSDRTNIPKINREALNAFVFTIPPPDLQAQFATAVQRIKTLKGKYEASLKGLEDLYGSMSGRAFRGELEAL
jgi:type I restriction enzyme S subunit